MLGLFIVCVLFIAVMILGVIRPAFGMIGFYAFIMLDPLWNWRWAIPQDFPFQKFLFVAACIGFVINGLKIPKFNRPTAWGLISLFGYLVTCYLSGIQSIDPERSQQFIEILFKQIASLTLAMALIDSPSKIKIFLVAAAIGQSYNAYQINLDYLQTGLTRWAYRSWGSYAADNNGYSLATLPAMAISFSFMLFEAIRWRKFFFLSILLLQVHQLYLLLSRGAWVGMLAMLAIILWKAPRTRTNIQLVSFLGLLGLILAGPSVKNEFRSIFASEEKRDTSAASRLLLWKAGYRIARENPVLGVGPDASRRLVPQARFYDGGLKQTNKALHNIFFQVASETGLTGLVTYLAFILIPIANAWKNYNPADPFFAAIDLAVIAGGAGYLTASNFSCGILIESSYILTIAGYCTIFQRHKMRGLL